MKVFRFILNFKIIFLYVSIGLLHNAHAQTNVDVEAQKILGKTTQALKSLESAKIRFTLEFNFHRQMTVVRDFKKGVLFFYKGSFRVELDNKEIISDGKTIWSFDKTLNEVTITNPDPSTDYLSPTKLLTNFYDKDFLYKLNGTKKLHSKSCYEVELTPFDKSKPFHKIYLYINQGSFFIEQIDILENTSNRIILRVNRSKEDKKFITKKTYTFDPKKYPGAEIIDLR